MAALSDARARLRWELPATAETSDARARLRWEFPATVELSDAGAASAGRISSHG
jgi:hypothetical protein